MYKVIGQYKPNKDLIDPQIAGQPVIVARFRSLKKAKQFVKTKSLMKHSLVEKLRIKH